MGSVFQNTIVSIISIITEFITPFVMMLVIELILPPRNKRWIKPLLYIGCGIFVGMIIYIGDPVNLPWALVALLLTVLICCDGTYLQRFSIFLILSSLGLSFNTMVDSYLGPNLWVFRNLFRLILWLSVYFTLKRFAPKQIYYLPPRLWALLDVLTLTPFSATLIIVLLGKEERLIAEARDVILLMVVTLSSFGLIWAMVVLARQQKLEQEKSFYRYNRMFYENLEQEQFQVRRLRHDMANHLLTMSALPEPELRTYLNDLICSPAMNTSQRFCENNVLNIVMAAKKIAAEQKSIIISAEIAAPQALPIRDADLCALLANSLDNAIEACEKLPVEDKKINVKAIADKGLFVLQVKNPLYEKIALKNGIPDTTKQNTVAHGLGLLSIRDIAMRYGGSMNVTTDERQFTLLIYIPI